MMVRLKLILSFSKLSFILVLVSFTIIYELRRLTYFLSLI
jgi:hypothetical protein